MNTKTDLVKQTIINLTVAFFLALAYKNVMAYQLSARFLITDTPVSNPPASPPPDFATTETAGTNFTLYLTAYHPNQGGIIRSYTGRKNIRFYSTYLNPSTGTCTLLINGMAVASSVGAFVTTQSIFFKQGVARLRGQYNDVGQLKLTVIDMADSPKGLSGLSGNFVVKPARFVLNVPNSQASQTQTAAACLSNTVFAKAGNHFTVNVQAQNALGHVTPNYGNETFPEGIILTSGEIYGPINARNGSMNTGAIANGRIFKKITSGKVPEGSAWSLPYFQGTSFSFDEVGCIHLTAAVSGGDYLGAAKGDVRGSVVVGRFTPDHFDVSGNAVQFKTACSHEFGSFTYLDQPFFYAKRPVLTVVARALGAAPGVNTQNYTGSFWKLNSSGFQSFYNKAYFAVNAEDTIPILPLSATLSIPIFLDVGSGDASARGAGTGTFSFAEGAGLKVQRLSGTRVPPFIAEIQLRISNVTDTDQVTCTGTGCSTGGFSFGSPILGKGIAFTGVGGGKQFYQGRLVVLGESAPETLGCTLPMQTQFYTTAGGFVLNTLDTGHGGNGTAFTGGAEHIHLTLSPGLSTRATVAESPNYYFQKGLLSILLSAPTGTTRGYADVEANIAASGANLPWLQSDWPYGGSKNSLDKNFKSNPRARCTFGIFKGNDRIIYEKEITH